MADQRDFYEVLGVSRTAGQDEIQRAYRKLARTYHPDVNKDPAADSRFKEIAEAYDVLSDPSTRQRYDAFGPQFRQVPEDADPSTWRGERHRAAANGAGPGEAHRTKTCNSSPVSATSISKTCWEGCSDRGVGAAGVPSPERTKRPSWCST